MIKRTSPCIFENTLDIKTSFKEGDWVRFKKGDRTRIKLHGPHYYS